LRVAELAAGSVVAIDHVMMLRREVPRFRLHTRWWVVGAVSASVMTATIALVLGPRLISVSGPSRRETARMTVAKLADEMYPEWLAMQPSRICPPSIDVLERGLDAVDPWGTRYRMECGRHSFVAISAGEDQTFGTADDVRSDR
jgi:hypothetical protein